MSRSLTIALLDWSPGWEILLEWMGLPWRLVHNIGELSVERFAVVICNRHLWKEEIEGVEGAARSGLGVLDTGRFLHHVRPESVRSSWVASAFPDQSDPLLTGLPVLDLHGRGTSPRHDPLLKRVLGFVPLGKGTVASLGVDPGLLMEDIQPRSKRFPGVHGKHPAERVARRTKGEIGLLLQRTIARLFHEQGLPVVRKRSFPERAENIFCFRVDSDYGSREQIDSLYDVARASGMPMTWFLHTEGHKGWLDHFASFEGEEIALHCARHKAFPDKEGNLANIREARRAMNGAGLKPVGYAAPTGLWNHGVGEAIDEEGFLYSSEFTLACDALPFYPILPLHRRVNQHFYQALQIPIHPVSVGNLARVGLSDKEMGDYYRTVIERKRYNREPLIFYHHPTHERWDVVEGIIESAREGGVQALTFQGYAEWWKKREEVRFEASYGEGEVVLQSINRDTSVLFDILLPDGRSGIVEHDGSILLSDLKTSMPSSSFQSDIPPHSLRRFSFTVARRALRDALVRMSR